MQELMLCWQSNCCIATVSWFVCNQGNLPVVNKLSFFFNFFSSALLEDYICPQLSLMLGKQFAGCNLKQAVYSTVINNVSKTLYIIINVYFWVALSGESLTQANITVDFLPTSVDLKPVGLVSYYSSRSFSSFTKQERL